MAIVGARLTGLDRWYRELIKPPWQPPDWAFGPAWTTVYAFCVWSVVIAWPVATTSVRVALIAAWGANVVLNVLWSMLFFRVKRPDWALAEAVLLWLSIVMVLVVNWRAHPSAGIMILPYLAWVSFATVLNRAIVRLNTPFSRT